MEYGEIRQIPVSLGKELDFITEFNGKPLRLSGTRINPAYGKGRTEAETVVKRLWPKPR